MQLRCKTSGIRVSIKRTPVANQNGGIGKCQVVPARHFGSLANCIFWHLADIPAALAFVRYWDNSGQRRILARDSDLTDFLNQRDRDYCIGMISSRW